MRKLLLLNGMTPGGRVFTKLSPLLSNYEIIEWISPEGLRSVSDYAKKLADELDLKEPCDVLGVSFGGIVAQELAPLIGAELCFVVSSIGSPEELAGMHRVFRKLPESWDGEIMKLVGSIGDSESCGSARVVRAKKYSGDDGLWFRWTTSAALRWRPEEARGGTRVIRIHGDKDKTLPRGHDFSDYVVKGAGHMLAISHAEWLAETIMKYRERKYT